jgi:hypothetical protein
MRNHARTAAALLPATAVGFGGYAIGTQGGSSAVARDAASRAAASGGDDGRRGPGGDLSALARRLDVSQHGHSAFEGLVAPVIAIKHRLL